MGSNPVGLEGRIVADAVIPRAGAPRGMRGFGVLQGFVIRTGAVAPPHDDDDLAASLLSPRGAHG